MIKQHYYTREKRGVYSDNPGYDTIAKSMGLSDKFVKQLLHKYCFYEIPAELLNESNYDRFPKSHTVLNLPSGEMIIGRTSFVPRDFEGKRSTFFTHNYVLSEEEKLDFIENPNKIICADGFKKSYNIADGTVLEDIKRIEMESSEMGFSSLDELLEELKINEDIFKEMVMACFVSVLENRRIYIILNVDISVLSFYAKELLKFIYKAIPYAVRKKLGFITYAKDCKSKDFIHIQFLSKGGVKSITTEVNSGYLFDFVGNRFLNRGIEVNKHEYLNCIIKNINNDEKINEIIREASNFCLDSLNIEDYDEFCKIILTSEEKEAFNSDDERKMEVFSAITKNEKLLAEFVKKNKKDEIISESLKEYAIYLTEKCTDLEEYFEIIEFCFVISPKFVEILSKEFMEKAEDIFAHSVYMADDFIFVDEKISLLENEYENENIKIFLNDILENLFDIFIQKVQPEAMTPASIEKIRLLPQGMNSENYEIISVLKKVVGIKNFDDAASAGVAVKNSQCKSKIEHAITRIYKLSINNENYLKIICGFLNNTGCDINEVISYVWQNGETKEAREFVIWLCRMYEKLFSRHAEHDLKRALMNYFEKLDTDFFDDSRVRNRILKESRKGIRQFIIKEDMNTAKGIRKLKFNLSSMFKKHQ